MKHFPSSRIGPLTYNVDRHIIKLISDTLLYLLEVNRFLFLPIMNCSHLLCSPQPMMTPRVPDPGLTVHAIRRTNSPKAGVPTRIKAICAPCKQNDILGALANQIVFEEQQAEEELPLCAERTISVCHAT